MANPDLQSVVISNEDPIRLKATFDIAVDVTNTNGLTATIGGSGNALTGFLVDGADVYFTLTTMAAVGDAVLFSINNGTTTIVNSGGADAALEETDFVGVNKRYDSNMPLRYLSTENKTRGSILTTARATKSTCKTACDVVVDYDYS